MANILFITTNSIRAAIGATDVELKDQLVEDLLVEDNLRLFLAKNYPDWSTLVDANKPAGNPTSTQQDQFRALKIMCVYAAAVICLQGGQNLLSQEVQSGGVTTTRFAKDDIETTLARMESERDRFLSILTGASDVETYFVNPVISSQPNFDPVDPIPYYPPWPWSCLSNSTGG